MIFSNAIVFLALSALRATYLVEGHGQHHHRHLGGSAAQKKCGTRAASTEDRAKAEEVSRQWSAARKADFTDVEIEVFIHVITDTSGNGALTMDNLNDSIDHLNNEYADTGFSFTLKGATCTADNDWYDSRDDREMQEALRVGDEKTLNVYYRSIEGNLGYATIPVWYNDDPTADGVVMRSDQYTGSGDAQYGEGDTLVHEIGHWLGLEHVFHDGFGILPFFYCLLRGDNDQVDDTPKAFRATYGCPERRNTCRLQPGDDPIHNFMNYGDDECLYEFTNGQVDRMQAQWTEYRASGTAVTTEDLPAGDLCNTGGRRGV